MKIRESLKSTEFGLTAAGAIAGGVTLVIGILHGDDVLAGVGAALIVGVNYPYVHGRSITKMPRTPVAPPRSA